VHKARNHVGKTGNPTCYACGQRGHKALSCDDKMKNRLWCDFCKTTTHTDKSCRRKPRESVVKHMNSDGDNFYSWSFAFKVDDFLMMTSHTLMHYWSIVVQRLML